MTTIPHAGHMLERAQWAASAYRSYDGAAVARIVAAVAAAGHDAAERFAAAAVAETGMGVVADKVVKNRACSRGIVEHYADHDYASPRVDPGAKIVEVSRPAGVVLALTPTTNPVATVYFKTILALMTRNAIVIAPHPRAKRCSADAAVLLAEAAVAAGAPDGVVQVVDEPSIPLIESMMADPRTDVIVATGGPGVVRAAYSSGNPALGVGPGNVPVFVDATADVASAARRIVDSKAFDNSVLCTNESVLIAEEAVAERLKAEMTRAGAHFLDPDATRRLRDYMFAGGSLNTDVAGREWEIVEVPAPETLTDAGGFVDYSYINHLVVNGGVIACSFGDPRDADAAAILAEQYPGREVVTVDARPLFERGGGIHCITQHQPSAR